MVSALLMTGVLGTQAFAYSGFHTYMQEVCGVRAGALCTGDGELLPFVLAHSSHVHELRRAVEHVHEGREALPADHAHRTRCVQ
jgi:hypothetical protein